MASQVPQKAKSTRVVVADDHDDMRKSICALLQDQNSLEVVGEAANGKQAIEATIKLHPDIIIMDLSMPMMDGLSAARAIKKASPEIAVLMFSMHTNKAFVDSAKKLGLEGFVDKQEDGPALLSAIETVMNHGTYYPD